MVLDRKHYIFLVKVIDRGHLNTAGGYAQGRVLDSLEFLNEGLSMVINIIFFLYTLSILFSHHTSQFKDLPNDAPHIEFKELTGSY